MGHQCLLLSELAGAVCLRLYAVISACYLRQPVLRRHTALCVAAALFLPVRAGALCSAALICGTKAAALGAGAAADLCFYRGNARPGRGAVLVQRRNELPAVFLACGAERGPCLCALLCCAAYAAAQGAVRSRRLFVQSGHRRRPSGSRAFESSFTAARGSALRTAA